jgi:hypothetical protein
MEISPQQTNNSGQNLTPNSPDAAAKGKKLKQGIFWKGLSLLFLLLFLFSLFFDVHINKKGEEEGAKRENTTTETPADNSKSGGGNGVDLSKLEEEVIPSEGIVLPIRWGDLGKKMVEAGVIDGKRLESIYEQRGGLDEYEKQLLYGTDNGKLKIDLNNSGFVLNLLWAFGLSNKNPILEEGPMMKYSGDASRFASTGGWSLAKGDVMDHYSKHEFVKLTKAQQELVEKVSQNIYRPCCNNPTYFPDCNHGMAMLGLLELLAKEGLSEQEMYKIALKANSFWFPSTYLTIGKYFKKRGVDWKDVDAKQVLGPQFSSASGYRQVLSQVEPSTSRGGSGCGI